MGTLAPSGDSLRRKGQAPTRTGGNTWRVLIMDAVLETYEAADFALWPVADPPAERLLTLSGDLSPLEVGTAVAALACYNDDAGEHRSPESSVELLHRLASAETVIAPGGLRIRDTTTGVTVEPGCCFGLENWRDWLGLFDGEEPWLGHDPTPGVEYAGPLVRLWPDAERLPSGPAIELPLTGLPGLLTSVRAHLTGFLGLVEQWAVPDMPAALTARLVTKLDESLTATAPLGAAG